MQNLTLSKTKYHGKKKKSLKASENRQKLLMTLLPLIKIGIFSYLPMVGLIVAFQKYKPRTMFLSQWVGFDNFKVIFANPTLKNLLFNAVVLNALFIVIGTIVAVLFALLMFEIKNKVFIKASQSVYLMPFFIAWPLVGMLVMSLFGMNGLITTAISKVFNVQVDFYNRPELWRGIMTLVYVWKASGMSIILYYAVLLGIDGEIYEAASIDGASRIQKMLHLSLPMLMPMILVGTIMSSGNILRSDFSMNFFIIGGNTPLYPTMDVLESYMYRALMNASNYGNLIAMGLLQGVVGLVLSYFANYFVKRLDKEASIF